MQPEESNKIEYDLLVNWEKRLRREVPFFEELFRKHAVRSVLDAGCGTGRHADMFAGWGLSVVGADVEERMIEIARTNFDRPNLDFMVCDFLSLGEGLAGRKFDAVLSLGNSLPQLESEELIAQAIACFASLLEKSGVLVLHLLNFDKWVSEEKRFEGPRPGSDPNREVVFLKIFDYAPGKVEVTILQMEKMGGQWTARESSGHLTPVGHRSLVGMCLDAGLRSVELYSDHNRSEFDADTADSLILAATR